ncbi:hypothetical protein Aph02nite_77450 [Actinoplanes philippinensis]|nr:hypothetical protein Aph02nite_77450 [Actinoplanes philippinensis]
MRTDVEGDDSLESTLADFTRVNLQHLCDFTAGFGSGGPTPAHTGTRLLTRRGQEEFDRTG